MKKAIILILLIILISLGVQARETAISSADEFRIDLVKYDPSPLEPGKYSDVWFEIINLGNNDIEDFQIKIVDNFPFSLKETDTGTVTIGKLSPGKAEPFKFNVMINKDINSGDHTLSLQYYSDKIGSQTSETFPISISRISKEFSVTSIEVSDDEMKIHPKNLVPGIPLGVSVNLHNSATYTIKDITLRLGLNNESIPISPISTSYEKDITKLNPNEKAEVIFDVIALPDADSGVYRVPLTIEYYDDLGNKYIRNDLVGLVVGAEPEIHIEVKSNEIYSKRGTGEITLNFVNTGLTKIKFLKVQLLESKKFSRFKFFERSNYKILSEDDVYLGDIDPDDDQSVDFRLKLSSLTSKVGLPIHMEYRDANNKKFSEDISVNLDIHSKKDMGLEDGSGKWKFFIVLIILIMFFIYYRRWKKIHKTKGILDYIEHLFSKFKRKK